MRLYTTSQYTILRSGCGDARADWPILYLHQMSDDSDMPAYRPTRQLLDVRNNPCLETSFGALTLNATNLSQMKWSRTSHCPFYVKGTTMKTLLNASKVLLVVAALGMAATGCERRATDQSSGTSGSSGTSQSGSSGSSGTSGSSGSMGGSGSSGSSGSSGTNK